jgi:transposase-like protein
MKKTLILLLVLVLAAFTITSCVYDTVSYCPVCGSMDIKVKSVSEGYPRSRTYECKKCGAEFYAPAVLN